MADASRNLQINVNTNDQSSGKFAKLGDQIKGSFDKISLASAAALTALVGFSVAGVKALADTGEHLDNLADTTGSTIGALSAFKATGDEMGLSIDSITTAMTKMNVNMNTFSGNSKTATDALGPLGLKLSDLKGLSPDEQFLKLGNAINAIENPALRAAESVKIFGKAGNELQPFFNGGNASMAEMTEHAKELGVYMDKSAAAAARNADMAFDSLSTTLKGASQQIIVALAPAITEAVNKLQPLIQQVTDWISKNPELILQIATWTAGLLAVGAVIGPLIGIVQGFGVALAFLAANPVVLVIAAVAAFAAGLVYLYNTNETVRNAINTAWTFISTKVQAVANFLSPFIKQWIEGIKAAWTAAWEFISNYVVPAFQAIGDGISSGLKTMQDLIKTGMTLATSIWQGFWDGFKNVVDAVAGTINGIVQGILKGIQSAWDALTKLTSSAGSAISSYGAGVVSRLGDKTQGGVIPARASGGPVGSGSPYLVGEEGPELFVPSSNGTIIPHGAGVGGGATYNIYVQGNQLLDENSGVRIGDQIMRSLRMQQRLS